MYKLVAGKASNGCVKSQDLGQWGIRAFNEQGWFGGFAIWEYSNDRDGSRIMSAAGELTNKFADIKLSKQ